MGGFLTSPSMRKSPNQEELGDLLFTDLNKGVGGSTIVFPIYCLVHVSAVSVYYTPAVTSVGAGMAHGGRAQGCCVSGFLLAALRHHTQTPNRPRRGRWATPLSRGVRLCSVRLRSCFMFTGLFAQIHLIPEI